MIKRFHRDNTSITFLFFSLLVTALLVVILSLLVKLTLKKIVADNKPIESIVYNEEVFRNAPIIATNYVVYDIVDKKIIAERKGELKVPLASLTKIMTAVTALNSYSSSTKIIIKKTNIDGNFDLGLKESQEWELGELLKYTLIFSSNDGAYAIADNLGGTENFVTKMNEMSTKLNLSLNFTNPAGLDEDGKLGGLGSAKDVAMLFAYARNEFPDILDATSKIRGNFHSSNENIIGIPNTNQMIENLFGSESSKTGFTDEAGGNLAIITDLTLGHPIVIVVLGSTKDGRFTDVKTLYNLTKKAIN